MHIVTLEGLPRTCHDVLRIIQQNKQYPVLPSPSMPSQTSHTPLVDEINTVFQNIVFRMKMLQRISSMGSVVCGAHWIESPPLGTTARWALHSLSLELVGALAEDLAVRVEKHTVIILHSSIHECFEHLLSCMEARQIVLDDLVQETKIMHALAGSEKAASPFPHTVHELHCPAFLRDNNVDLLMMASRVSNIIKACNGT
jgi:hypothetical protein